MFWENLVTSMLPVNERNRRTGVFHRAFVSRSGFTRLGPLLLCRVPVFFVGGATRGPTFPLKFSTMVLFSYLYSSFHPILRNRPSVIFTMRYSRVRRTTPRPNVRLLGRVLVPGLLSRTIRLATPNLTVLSNFANLIMLHLHYFVPASRFIMIPIVVVLILHSPNILNCRLLCLINRRIRVYTCPIPLLFRIFYIDRPFLRRYSTIGCIHFIFSRLVSNPSRNFLSVVLYRV